jgi:hypothetical protein
MEAAIFLALVNERLVEYFIAPLFDRFYEEGRWLLMYVALVTGALLSFLARVDLMAVAGVDLGSWGNLIVSAIIVGGGANLIHDLLKGRDQVVVVDEGGKVVEVRSFPSYL